MSKIDRDNLGYIGFDFQVRLMAQIMTDEKFATSIIDILNPNYFDDLHFRIICAEIKNAYHEYEIIPDMGSLEARLLNTTKDDIQRKFIVSQLRKIQEANLNDSLWVQDTAMKFCKQQELKKSIKEIQTIIEKGNIDDYLKCEEILKKALEVGNNKDDGSSVHDDIDEVLADDYRKPIPTGIKGLDEVMNGGLSKGELAIILAAFGVGKAQPLLSKILTPTGWTTMGQINVGDKVISKDGKPCDVIGVYPQGIRPIYKVSFNDGTSTLCDKEHLWFVNSINQRNRSTRKNGKIVKLKPDNSFKVVRTIDMINKLTFGTKKQLSYKIPIIKPVSFDKVEVPIDPYIIGVLLGDGCITEMNQPHFVTKDLDIINNVKERTNKIINVSELSRDIMGDDGLLIKTNTLLKASILGIKNDLKNISLYGTNSKTKFIPNDYLYNDINSRIALLQGLVDTDGYIDEHRIEISTTSKKLSDNIRELILSLGGRVTISEKQGRYKINDVIKETSKYYRIWFSFPDNGVQPSLCKRKLDKYKPRTKYSNNKFIKSIEYSHEEEAQCIMVNNPEHLYVTDDYIVTHNTTMITKIANTAKNLGLNVLQIFFEDMPKVIKRKHLACWSGYELNDLGLHKEELKELNKKKEAGGGKLILKKFSSDGTTIPMIRQYIRKKLSQGIKIDLVLLDYIDCVSPSKHFDDSNVAEGNVMRQFESMLVELDIAGWVAIQGNRASIKADVVESDQMSGSIKKGMIGHFIVSVAKTLDQKEAGTATMAILKSRFGKDGLIFQDIIFDNSRIQIDMGENKYSKTQKEYNTDTEKATQRRVNTLLEEAMKVRREAMNNNLNENIN